MPQLTVVTAPQDSDTETPVQRMQRAAHGLNAVMARQRREVAAFRSSMSDLRGTMDDLRSSMDVYRDKLDAIPIGRLNREARRLEQTMEDYLRDRL